MPGRPAQLPPELTDRPFTRREAIRRGVTPDTLRGPAVQRIDRGLYLDARLELTLIFRLAGYLMVLPRGSVIDGVTALQLAGVDVGPAEPYRFCTTASHHTRRTAIRVRRTAELPDCRGRTVRPVPALVVARAELCLRDLVVAGDWVIRLQLATLDEVREGLGAATGRDHERARRAGELVRERVESPRETRLRLVLVLAGLPDPECNVDLGDELFFIARVDLYLRAWNIVIEYEGDHHRTDAQQFHRDLGRYEQLAAAGYLAVRISKEAMKDPCGVVERVFRALQTRGYAGPAPSFGEEWCAAFGRPRRSTS